MVVDRSSTHFLMRALAVGIVVGFLASGVMVWRHRVAYPAPPFPIELPSSVAWANRSTTTMPDGAVRRLTEAFVADGPKFRLEVARPHQPAVVWVFDGKELAVNAKVPERAADELDPRRTLGNIYASFPALRYKGTENVGGYRCWVFQENAPGVRSVFWIDRRTNAPRRVLIRYDNGRVDEQLYENLPEYRIHRDGLFDRSNLRPALIESAEAMTGA